MGSASRRRKLLEDGHIDTVIGLPANLFYSTGIPVCILVLKKCKKPDDVLFINAEEYFEKGKRQNYLTEEHIGWIVDTYQHRIEESDIRGRVEMDEKGNRHEQAPTDAPPTARGQLSAGQPRYGRIEVSFKHTCVDRLVANRHLLKEAIRVNQARGRRRLQVARGCAAYLMAGRVFSWATMIGIGSALT